MSATDTDPAPSRSLRDAAVARAGERRERRARSRLPEVLGALPRRAFADAELHLLSAEHDMVILRSEDRTRIVRRATSPRGIDALTAQAIALQSLRDDRRLTLARPLLPRILDVADDLSWMAESVCEGVPGSALEPTARRAAAREAALTLQALHEVTAEQVLVDGDRLDQWVDGPVRVIERAVRDRRARRGLDQLRRHLRGVLDGRSVTVGRLHGDPSLDNLLFDEDGRAVRGIVDWEASLVGLPAVDHALLLLAEHRRRRGGETGTTLVTLLRDGLGADERELLGREVDLTADGLTEADALALAWLHHVASNLLKSSRYRTSGWWIRHNVVRPARALSTLEVFRSEAPAPVRESAAVAAPGRVLARPSLAVLALSGAAVALWAVPLWGVDPGDMTDLGLLSLLAPTNLLALGLLLAAFGVEISRRRPQTWRLAVPLVTFVGLVHGTPAQLYGTLRYSWAWKHLGIIDFIDRTGTVDPAQPALDVYHNWPGFFTQTAALLELMGIGDPARLAAWWPVIIQLATIPILLLVFSGLGSSVRVRWSAVALVLVSNWVGQDYFSPQSEAFLMYLVVVAVMLHRFPREPRRAVRIGAEAGTAAPWSGPGSVALVVALSAAIITSHQITPFMLAVAMVGLALTGRVRAWWAAGVVGGLSVAWLLTGARTFMEDNLRGLTETVGRPVSNADDTLVDTGQLSAAQQLVSTMGRLAVVLLLVLAAAAMLRQLWQRRLRLEAAVLALSPALMVVTNNFDGEIVFRTYLFALPFLAWFIADGIWGRSEQGSTGAGPSLDQRARERRAAATVGVAALLLVGFLFGYYGKDQWYYFSAPEVAASAYVLDDAPPDSLLVTISANYPGQFRRYENLTYVPIASEPAEGQRAMLADPAAKLEDWLGDPRYRTGYVLLTRSQADEVESTALMPRGSVEEIRQALRISPRFDEVFSTPEASVFVLTDPPAPEEPS